MPFNGFSFRSAEIIVTLWPRAANPFARALFLLLHKKWKLLNDRWKMIQFVELTVPNVMTSQINSAQIQHICRICKMYRFQNYQTKNQTISTMNYHFECQANKLYCAWLFFRYFIWTVWRYYVCGIQVQLVILSIHVFNFRSI